MPRKKPQIEINSDFARALSLLEETKRNVFITGKAGTGKSTLLHHFRETTKKSIVVLAPTGVAALNVKGQTIHSFFKFPPHISPQQVREQKPNKKLHDLLKNLDVIVIDEVSMVRADMMDCIDEILRLYLKNKRPFGGVQMIFIGDLYQLPPVVAGLGERDMFKTYYKSPYFFDGHVFAKLQMEFVELEKIYRQKDPQFIGLLNKIRNNQVEEADIKLLNSRHLPDFDHAETKKFFITLTTTNAAADEINSKRLGQLEAKSKHYEGELGGDFAESHLPTARTIELKVGSQVMLLNNDSAGRWVNGSVGKIIEIEYDEDIEEDTLIVALNDGGIVEVNQHTWDVYRYIYNKKKAHLDVESAGNFTQYPVRLAWAVTIHKSQGKTFHNVVVDIGRGSFTHGQVYVAISRCTSFEGLILQRPILKRHIFMDFHIVRFLTRFQYAISEEKLPFDDKLKLIKKAIQKKLTLEIVYLKSDDTKSHRSIKPLSVGDREFLGKRFMGLEAYCMIRQGSRMFRVDRILEIKI